MAEKKRSIGFVTPTKEIQDTFASVQAELSETRVNWANLRHLFNTRSYKLMEGISEDMESNKPVGINRLIDAEVCVLSSLISRLGMEVVETHERLAKCQKAIEELKLKIK